MVEIKETTRDEIRNIQSLWADGDVMKFVGFPDGLHQTDESMQKWFEWISTNRPFVNHYSVFEDGRYCGEAFYEIDKEHDYSAALDIKLFAFARGRGIAAKALSYAMDEAFRNSAHTVWVDPNPENDKAIALYEKLGFERKEMPAYLMSDEWSSIYMEYQKPK